MKEKRKYSVVFIKMAVLEIEAPSAEKAEQRALIKLKDKDFETETIINIERIVTIGTRVEVGYVEYGETEESYGEGTIEDLVEVYVAILADGTMISTKTPETTKPSTNVLSKDVKVQKIESHRIKLDSGEIVYGCQVWWRPLWEDDNEEPLRKTLVN